MKIHEIAFALFAILSPVMQAQRRPPAIEWKFPDPGENRIEVRFAIGDKALQCAHFHLSASFDGRVIMNGRFSSGFQIPKQAKILPHRDAVDLDIRCGAYRWHFKDVGERAFLKGWWWVGTDYPPFQETLQDPRFQDAAWIQYFIVDPVEESGFYFYHMCPSNLLQQKPGPCHLD